MEDVTSKVDFGEVDDECLPLLKCVCGKEFARWKCILSIYKEDPWVCECGRKLIFRNAIKVFDVSEELKEKGDKHG